MALAQGEQVCRLARGLRDRARTPSADPPLHARAVELPALVGADIAKLAPASTRRSSLVERPRWGGAFRFTLPAATP